MDQNDKLAFGLELGILAEVLLRGESLTPARIEAYFEDLAVFPLDEVRAAIRYCRRSCQFFPAPIEIIEAVRQSRRARVGSTPRIGPSPPSDEERRKVHELVSETVRKLRAGESLR